MRRYRVAFRNSAGKVIRVTVQADSEADAILAAKQKLRRDHPRFVDVSAQAIATED